MSDTLSLNVDDTSGLGNTAPSGSASALVLASCDAVPARPMQKPGRVILWQRYRERISYSSCNEDSASEMKQFDDHAMVHCFAAAEIQ
ncbi:MAG TPA: hypothetical protein VJ860_24270 [Polyangia bacterium]|nr:hypothetical protein [Polyangia bacterium]